MRNPHHYLTPGQRVPGYLPYAEPVSPGDIPVPNEAQCFWPHGQMAPEFFPSGSKSFTPFEFPNYSSDMASDESAHLLEDTYSGPLVDDAAGTITMTRGEYIAFFLAGMAAGAAFMYYGMQGRQSPL